MSEGKSQFKKIENQSREIFVLHRYCVNKVRICTLSASSPVSYLYWQARDKTRQDKARISVKLRNFSVDEPKETLA
jgi:hypothetical protein